jgi:hypothetical protein
VSIVFQTKKEIMLLRIWQNMQLVENALADPNAYKMYSTIITEGA